MIINSATFVLGKNIAITVRSLPLAVYLRHGVADCPLAFASDKPS
ncbi:hypothetical protein swp_4591 [Shewanella piezotolerans WP3]|uniref:Uncharacterized protein n=1 Tax=Shewanella piezotolerans (strain WP3 / JCM 13877) TaxID=225849 RepID=B8CUN9_SHEPW|nr:hypothetical protein swp_4591 [Shewanella piezotolerans WP3]